MIVLKRVFCISALLLIFSCSYKEGPQFEFAGSADQVAPGTEVTFSLSEIKALGNSELTYCEVEILTAEGAPVKSYHQVHGEGDVIAFTHLFGLTGDYVVNARVSDSKQQLSEKSLNVNVSASFNSAAVLDIGFTQAYQNSAISLSSSSVASDSAAEYQWVIIRVEGKKHIPVHSGSGALYALSSGISEPGEYLVQVTLIDAYGNSQLFSDSLTVVDAASPIAQMSVTDPLEGADVLEHQEVMLDASGSTADALDGTANKIEEYRWHISVQSGEKDGVALFTPACEPIVKTTAGAFAYLLGAVNSFELYRFELEVVTTIGKTSTTAPFDLSVKPNSPRVTAADFINGGVPIYEGKSCSVQLRSDVVSITFKKGAIEKVIMDFADEKMKDLEIIKSAETPDPLFFSWTAPSDGEIAAEKFYTGQFFIVNEGGRRSAPYAFSVKVIGNDPVAKLSLPAGESFFHGDDIQLSADGSGVPIAGDLESITLNLFDITDAAAPALLVTHDLSADPTQLVTYTLSAGFSGNRLLKAQTVVVAKNKAADEVEKIISSRSPYLMAVYSMNPDPDQGNVYAGHDFSFDASASKDAARNAIDPAAGGTFEFVLEKILDNGSASLISLTQNAGNLSAITQKLSDPGTYRMTLRVCADTAAATPEYSDPFVKVFSVSNNVPQNMSVTQNAGANRGDYIFIGDASAPDGSSLSYKWYVNQYPASLNQPGGLPGKQLNISFTHGIQYLYLVAISDVTGIGGILEYSFEAEDIQPPLAPTVTSLPLRTNNKRPVWNWTGPEGDTISKYRYKFSNQSVVDPAWTEVNGNSFTSAELIEGTYGLYVQACDQNGNWPSEAYSNTTYTGYSQVVVDLTPTAAPVVSGADHTNVLKPTWSWAAVPGAVRYRYQMNSEAGNWQTTSDSFHTPLADLIAGGIGDESFTLYVQAEDDAGNWSLSGSKAIRVDTLAPAAPVVGALDDLINTARPTWTFGAPAGEPSVIGYRFKVGTDAWTEMTDLNSLPAGVTKVGDSFQYLAQSDLALNQQHVLTVQVMDGAGNWGENGAKSVSIDTIPLNPETAITITGAAVTQNRKPGWTFIGSAEVAALQYEFNATAGNWTDGNSFTVTTDLIDGSYIIYVRALDHAGNWSTAKIFTTVIDTVGPVVTLASGVLSPEPVPYNVAGGDYAFSIADVVVEYNIDGILTGDNTKITAELTGKPAGIFTLDQAQPGLYQVTYSATDSANNVGTLVRTVEIQPRIPNLSTAALVAKTNLETGKEESFGLSGAVGNVNAHGGALTYFWTVLNGATEIYTDTAAETASTQLIAINPGAVSVTVKVKVSYVDNPEVFSEKSFTVTYRASLTGVVVNGDFEAGTNVAPWKWDLDWRKYTWPSWSTENSVPNGPDNYSWWYTLCSRSDTGGVADSKSAVMHDTSYNPGGTADDMAEYTGMLVSGEISLPVGFTYRAKAMVNIGVTTITSRPQKCYIGINDNDTWNSPIVAQSPVHEAKGWSEITVDFTPVETVPGSGTSQFRICLYRGNSYMNWSTGNMVDGEIVFDNVVIEYAN